MTSLCEDTEPITPTPVSCFVESKSVTTWLKENLCDNIIRIDVADTAVLKQFQYSQTENIIEVARIKHHQANKDFYNVLFKAHNQRPFFKS